MRIYAVGGPRARAIADFGSTGVTLSPLARPGGAVQIARFDIAPGGQIGAHPATSPQLLVVLAGTGWASGADGQRVTLRAGQAAFWEAGEVHASGSDTGLTAIVVEAETLDPGALLTEIADSSNGTEGTR